MANIELDGPNKKIKVDSGDLTLDVPGDIVLDADGGDVVFADGGTNLLKVTNSSSDVVLQPQVDTKDIVFKQYDGTVVATVEDNATFNIPASKLAIGGTAVTSTAAELNILDGVTATATELNLIDGVTATTAELNILDGVTATAAEINLIDGGTARGTTAIADGDGVLINDAGTMRMTSVETLKTYMGGDDNAPSFRAYLSSVQAISNTTRTILAFNNDSGTTGGIKAYDTNNAFNTSTYKFTPQTAGYYYAYLYCGLQDLNSGNFYQLNLCKNGSADGTKFSQFYIRQNGTDSIYGHTSGVAYLNGSSDYIVAVMQHNHGSNRNTSDTYNTGFGAFRLAGVS